MSEWPEVKCDMPWYRWESRLIDVLNSRGQFDRNFFDLHEKSWRARYRMQQPPEMVADDYCEMFTTYLNTGGKRTPTEPTQETQSKAMRDTMRAVAVARRLGQMV